MPKLSDSEQHSLLELLETRFKAHMHRHEGINWETVQAQLEAHPEQLWSLLQMELTGGEPDVVVLDKTHKHLTFIDCCPESPKGRRSLCYDRAALDARKQHKPKDSAQDVATAMKVSMLTETEYRTLQTLEPFDTKTSSWIQTPEAIRKLGGAIFCDNRYKQVFTYHNGADSYYAARGFRGKLEV